MSTTVTANVLRTGMFHCPKCQSDKPYTVTRFSKYFSIGNMPLLLLKHLHDQLECNTCRKTHLPENILNISEYTSGDLH